MPNNRKGRPRDVERLPARYPDRRKVCPACEQEKPWAAFYVKERWPDGLVKAVRSRCKLCESAIAKTKWQEKVAHPDREDELAARRAYHQQRMATDPEYAERVRKTIRENNRLRYASDPEYREQVKERARRASRDPRVRELARKRNRRLRRKRQRETSMRLRPEPWCEWLNEQLQRFKRMPETRNHDGPLVALAEWLGVDESGLRRWFDGVTGVRLDTADATFCRIGDPALLMELWPELYEDTETRRAA